MVLSLMKLDLNYKFKSRLHRGKICMWGLDRGRVDKNKERMSGSWVMNPMVRKWYMWSVYSLYL